MHCCPVAGSVHTAATGLTRMVTAKIATMLWARFIHEVSFALFVLLKVHSLVVFETDNFGCKYTLRLCQFGAGSGN